MTELRASGRRVRSIVVLLAALVAFLSSSFQVSAVGPRASATASVDAAPSKSEALVERSSRPVDAHAVKRAPRTVELSGSARGWRETLGLVSACVAPTTFSIAAPPRWSSRAPRSPARARAALMVFLN